MTNQRVYKYVLQVGRYYCVASNERGQATKSILVTGLASNIRVTSDRSEIICGDIFVFISKLLIRFSQLDTEYLLQWEAETESDVSEWVILVSSQSEAMPD